MAVYKKLLLSSGGGIISSPYQAEQVKNTATVLIGLGGTGIDCLRTIKTQVYSRLKQDDPKSVVAEYAHIRFLGVDAAETSKGDANKDKKEENEKMANARLALEDTESFQIGKSDIKKLLKHKAAFSARSELDWLRREEIKATNLGEEGAGGNRQIGRFLMMDRSDDFLDRIETEINNAKEGLTDPPVYIHIFSGLSGGTGAGCFLDVCYMVRAIAAGKKNVKVFGYFFLPDVNLSKISSEKKYVREYIPINGYASMQELNYCMQLQYNGGSFVQKYKGNKEIEWTEPPVDMCHLICATNANGDVIPDAYEYAMHVTTEYVMDFLTDSNGGFDLAQHLANFEHQVEYAGINKQYGVNLNYCVFGAACASVPIREINTYLASALFAKFTTIKDRVPSKEECEVVAKNALARDVQNVNVKEIYDSIYNEMRNGAEGDYSLYPGDWKDIEAARGDEDFVNHYTNQTARMLNRAETNASSLASGNNEKSLLLRVVSELNRAVCDIEKGPFFAHRLIDAAESHNLLDIIKGLKDENTYRWQQEEFQYKDRKRNYENARDDFWDELDKRFVRKCKKKFEYYEMYVRQYEQHKLACGIYKKIDGVLDKLWDQVDTIGKGYYKKLRNVMETILETFEENRKELIREDNQKQSSNSFFIPMMTIKDLKDSLDAEVKKVNISGMLDSFMRLFLNNKEAWNTENENKIAKLVTSFFEKNAFEGFAYKTITTFLADKYDLDTQEEFEDRIYQDWFKELAKKAHPLFCYNTNIWRESDTSRVAYWSIPDDSIPIKNAAEKFNANNPKKEKWEIKKSTLTDRIYAMYSACVLPLSAYKKCEDYEKEVMAIAACPAGTHYYEGKPISGIRFDDWRELPFLTPQSLMNNKIPNVTQHAQRLYDEAVELKIISDDGIIQEPSENGMKDFGDAISLCEEYILNLSKPEEIPAAKDALNNLEERMKVPMVQTGYVIKEEGLADRKEEIRKDNFVFAPVYQMVVKDSLQKMKEKREEADRVRKILSDRILEVEKEIRSLADYCDAIFTGVISIEGRMIIYHQNDFGVITDYTLSKRDKKEFEYCEISIYQGFVSYQALSGKMKEEIKKSVDERYNTDSPEIITTGKKLKELFNDGQTSAWVQLAAGYSNRGEIVDFLKKLKERFHIFCLENNIQ